MILEASGLTKYYGAVRAIEGVGVELREGEILAIVGDNGAGKTTVMNILAGALVPDRGEIRIDGGEVRFRSPHDAHIKGITAVYQDLAIVEQRDVVANLFLGRERIGRTGFLHKRQMMREAEEALRSLRISMPSVRAVVGNLSGGQRQAVAISRAVMEGGRIVLMDEPTAALGIRESSMVLNLVQELASRGVSVVIISHNLKHVLSVADSVLVMQKGEVAGVTKVAGTTEEEMADMILGRRNVGSGQTVP